MKKIIYSNGARPGPLASSLGNSARQFAASLSLWPPIATMALLVGVLAVSSCGISPYRPEVGVIDTVASRALVQNEGSVQVRVSVPTPEETKLIFDAALYDGGIQPVWIEVTNRGSIDLRYAPVGTDPEYFPAHEVAFANQKPFSKAARKDMQQYLHGLTMPRTIGAGETQSGFIFTNARLGTKDVNVDLFGPDKDDGHSLIFFVSIPGFVADHAEVSFDELYKSSEFTNYSLGGLRQALKTLPCCATNQAGTAMGDWLNFVLVGEGEDVLQALLRAGWDERPADELESGEFVEVDHLYGRPADALFRRSRPGDGPRSELRLWMSPMRASGKTVWIANVVHMISERDGPVEISPDIDDARNFLLQDLWYAQSLDQYAWVKGPTSDAAGITRTDLYGNAYETDGYRIVAWPTGAPRSMLEAKLLPWDGQPKPVRQVNADPK